MKAKILLRRFKLSSFLCLFFIQVVFAQPANDDCAQATILPVSITGLPVFTASSTNTATPSLSGCTGTATADVWFSFTALQSTQYIYLQHNVIGPTNSVIQVFSGTCGATTSLSCNNGLIFPQNFPNTAVLAQTGLVIGQTYLVRIYYDNTTTNAFSIGVANAAPNNDCSDAVSLAVSPDANSVFIAGTTFGATASTPNNTCIFSSSNDVWYRFTATASVHAIDILQLNTPRIQVFTGACGSLVAIPCNFFYQTIADTNRATVSGLVPGTTYLVKVFSNNFNTSNRFQIAVQTPFVAPNDVCSNATVLPVSGNSCMPQRISFRGALPDQVSHPQCVWPGIQDQDIWYSITAANTRLKVKFEQADGQSTWAKRMAFYSGTCNNLTSLVCGVSDSFSISGLTAGATYYLRVAKTGGSAGDSLGQLCAFVPDAVPYDECINAAALPVGNMHTINYRPFTTHNASYSAGVSSLIDPFGIVGSNNDIFLKFTATSATSFIGLAPGTTGLHYAIFTGGCAAPVAEFAPTTLSIDVKFALATTVGQEYFIWLSSAVNEYVRVGVSSQIDPPNKVCGSALPVVAGVSSEKSIPVKVQFGSSGLSMPSCPVGYTHETWFSFQAPSDSLGIMLAAPFQGFGWEILSGDCNSPVSVKCGTVNAGINWAPSVINGLTAGTAYLLRILSNGFTPESRQPLLYLFNAKKSGNNYCTQAVNLAVQSSSGYSLTAGSTAGHYNEVNNCTTTGEAWYSFTATGVSHTLVLKGNLNPRLSLYTGQCGSLSLLSGSCITAAQAGRDVRSLVNLTPGTTYFIRVAGTTTFANSGPFEIAITNNNTPSNDDCSNPIMLTIQQLQDARANQYFTTRGSTASVPGSLPASACAASASGDIWFGFTGNGKQVSLETEVLNNNYIVYVYSGTCGSFSEVTCGDNAGLLSIASQNSVAYRVRVVPRVSGTQVELRMRVYETPALLTNQIVETNCLGSNLVLNPGLDTLKVSSCPPSFVTQPSFGQPQYDLVGARSWTMANYATTDVFSICGGINRSVNPIFNACFGSQSPRSGTNFGGIYAHTMNRDYQEYLQGQLAQPLVAGKTYLFNFNVSLSDFSALAIDRLGVYFSSNLVQVPIYGALPFVPQAETPAGQFFTEKLGWTTISFLYTPTEAVQYFVIGNFRYHTETNTAPALDNGGRNAGGAFSGCSPVELKPNVYYFVDDISLAEVTGTGCLLPINDLTWDAIGRQGQGIITWNKKDESDVASFSIEHSINGTTFDVVNRQPALALSSYRFVDHKLTAGKHFYRIRVHYKDGQTEVTNIKAIEIGSPGRIQVYPTITKGNVLIRGIVNPSQVQVMMPQGSILQKLVISGDGSIDLSRYPAGLYIITIAEGNKEQVHFRVIKE